MDSAICWVEEAPCTGALLCRYRSDNRSGRLRTDRKPEAFENSLWTRAWGGSSLASRETTQCVSMSELQSVTSSTEINSFVARLRACARNRDLAEGTRLHNDLMENGLLNRCSNAVVAMYAKCGELEKANELLLMSRSRDVMAWTALISGYANEAQGDNALSCFQKMQDNGMRPNEVTYLCALKACALTKAVDKGQQIHQEIVRQGLLHNKVALGNALVDMYSKCGDVWKAQRVLRELPIRDVVSWNSLISGFAQKGESEQAWNCLMEMHCEGIEADAVTYLCALKACVTPRAAERGKQIHDKVARQGLLQNHPALGGALVDMYAKCGNILQAQEVLKKLPNPDVVTWSALMAGYIEAGEPRKALHCLQQMQHEGVCPDGIIYANALRACAMMKDADKGTRIHDEIERQRWLENDVVLGNALVDMYAKCGNFAKARQVLQKLPFRDVVTWNALITGYAQKGKIEQAFKSLDQMKSEGILPNEVTCACLLNLCSHLGLVEEGQAIFASMTEKYALEPSQECFSCMIDLFGRAGHLEKAVHLIQKIRSLDEIAMWHTLLGTCWKWADVSVGVLAFETLLRLNKNYGPAYIMMGNIFVAAGMGERAKSIQAMGIRNHAFSEPERS